MKKRLLQGCIRKLREVIYGLSNLGFSREGKQPHKKKSNIRTKLILSFFVPIAFIIILGIVSFQIAKNNIQEQYEKAAVKNAESMSNYFDLLCSTVEYNATEILNDEAFSGYYRKYYAENNTEAKEYFRGAQTALKTMKGSCTYVYSYNVLAEKGKSISSTSAFFEDTAYQSFIDSEKSSYIMNNINMRGIWTGYHSFLDDFDGIVANNYSLCYTKEFVKGNGYLLIDIKSDYIIDVLNENAYGKENITGLVTPDNRETVVSLSKDGKTYQTVQEDVFTKSGIHSKINNKMQAGCMYITYNNIKYLLVYSPIGNKGLMICSMIPGSVILKEVSGIRNITVIMVVLACIVALFIGNVISAGISLEIKSINIIMGMIAKGDLTAEFKTKRNDEFKILSEGIKLMLTGIRGLIRDMQGFGRNVTNATLQVSDSSSDMVVSMSGVMVAIGEVTQGITSQAESSEKGFQMMEQFSDQLNEIYISTSHMGQSADQAILSVERGQKMVDDLNGKSSATANITKILIDDINEVYLQSDDIGSIVNTINEIASQTNLLSLNASIEAARAGNHGKVFAVVADEIRKLAEQSAQSGNRIKHIVENIQKTTGRTTVSARRAGDFIEEQKKSLSDTIAVFIEINETVGKLVQALKENSVRMENMMNEKKGILSAIQDIASISEEASAATQEVQATIDEQLSSIKNLAKVAEQLNTEMGLLEVSLKQFKVKD